MQIFREMFLINKKKKKKGGYLEIEQEKNSLHKY